MGAEATDTRPRLHVGLKAGQWEKPPASLCFCSPVSGPCRPPLAEPPWSHLARTPGRGGWAEGNQAGVSVRGCSRVTLWEPDLILQDTPGICISICCLPIILNSV